MFNLYREWPNPAPGDAQRALEKADRLLAKAAEAEANGSSMAGRLMRGAEHFANIAAELKKRGYS